MKTKHVRSLNAQEILELIFIYLTEVSSLRDYDSVIEVLANMGRALTSADRCTVWIVSDDKKTIWTKVAHGIEPIEIPIDSGVVGYSITHGEKIIIDDAYKDSRFNPNVDKETGYKTKSIMVIPMFDNDNNIIGAFQVINHLGEKGTFDKRDMQRLMLASTYAAETLNAAKLTQEIKDTQKEVIFTMGAIGESRSKETGNHVKRVAEYSKILALGLGMNEEEAELLKQASPMHDIGKVAIPDEVLKKPARFTKAERKIMETHAKLGYDMLKNSSRELLKTAAIVAYEHHEKWDGSGYPQGLKGEEIHIYGRITALADVFDALGSDRVYKKAWPTEKILKLIKEEKGKHFDPKLVDVFFEKLDTILHVRDKFKDEFDANKSSANQKQNSIQVLGAFGTKLKGFGTSSFLLNEKNTIDAGNILETMEEFSANLDTIWLTHSHLDHIIDIAYIMDNYYAEFKKPLVIAGLKETIEALKNSFLNGNVWPDFSKINLLNSEEKCINYKIIDFNQLYKISENETIEPFKTDHTVKSCGYIYTKNDKAILITSDTYSLESAIEIINTRDNINSVVIECSFPSYMKQLAIDSKHLTPELLFSQLDKSLKRKKIKIYINHIKPIYLNQIIEEMENYTDKYDIEILNDKKIINF